MFKVLVALLSERVEQIQFATCLVAIKTCIMSKAAHVHSVFDADDLQAIFARSTASHNMSHLQCTAEVGKTLEKNCQKFEQRYLPHSAEGSAVTTGCSMLGKRCCCVVLLALCFCLTARQLSI